VKQSLESKEKTFEALRIKMSRELERPGRKYCTIMCATSGFCKHIKATKIISSSVERTKSFLVFNKSFTSLRLYDMETHVQEIISVLFNFSILK